MAEIMSAERRVFAVARLEEMADDLAEIMVMLRDTPPEKTRLLQSLHAAGVLVERFFGAGAPVLLAVPPGASVAPSTWNFIDLSPHLTTGHSLVAVVCPLCGPEIREFGGVPDGAASFSQFVMIRTDIYPSLPSSHKSLYFGHCSRCRRNFFG